MNGPATTYTKEDSVVFSKSIKAGKRIYYLDVRKNRREELFLTITESRKISFGEGADQAPQFEKHKIFLYKEDFDSFLENITEVIEYIKKNNRVNFAPQHTQMKQTNSQTETETKIELSKPIKLDIKF